MGARRALVTGGGRGIGLAIARALTEAGHEVTIAGRTVASLEAAVAAGAAKAWRAVDVTDASPLAAAIDAAGPFDILINNAGAAESAPLARTDTDLLRRMMAVNVESALTATRAVLPGMVERGFGRIVNIASIAAVKGFAYIAAYCAAKHALLGLTRATAAELVRTGVTVNALCPGYTDTDLVAESARRIAARTGRGTDEALAAMVAENPIGRLIRPDEVAAAALWLCGDAAAAVTGQAIVIAGGDV
jgi:NAD(P)-dependent dehydrogenase (short-subunit alcohol dehydrogenase family)